MQIIEAIAAQAPQLAALRRDIHAHPELCFEELRTADLVAAKLSAPAELDALMDETTYGSFAASA